MGLSEYDYATTGALLQNGLDYCHMQGIAYNQLLFLLSKIMVSKRKEFTNRYCDFV